MRYSPVSCSALLGSTLLGFAHKLKASTREVARGKGNCAFSGANGDLDLRLTSWGRWDALYDEPTENVVASGKLSDSADKGN